MKNMERGGQDGFILKIMLVVVGMCLLFIVFSTLARSLGNVNVGGGLSALPTTVRGTTAEGQTNNLLKFLDNTNGPQAGSTASPSTGGSSQGSPYSGLVRLGSGNGPYTIQPTQEYITLQNSSSKPVDITGWTVTNGKGTRPIQTRQNDYIYPIAESAVIGQGTEFLDPSGAFSLGDIVLKPGDNAIVTTSRAFSQFPFSITTNFRENICVGYLKDYPFQPSLDLSCPLPSNDPAIRTVTNECYDYMQTLSSCEDPYVRDRAGYDMQTGQCRTFMNARLNYPACVVNAKGSAGFSTGRWRIFLGKTRELWADRRETITLYDKGGLIVDQISY